MLLQEKTEVENGLLENALGMKDEGDEQAAYTSVSVQEWVHGLELDVSQSSLRKRVHGAVQEGFPGREALGQLLLRRGDKGGIAKSAPSDPVLGSAELPRLFA